MSGVPFRSTPTEMPTSLIRPIQISKLDASVNDSDMLCADDVFCARWHLDAIENIRGHEKYPYHTSLSTSLCQLCARRYGAYVSNCGFATVAYWGRACVDTFLRARHRLCCALGNRVLCCLTSTLMWAGPLCAGCSARDTAMRATVLGWP